MEGSTPATEAATIRASGVNPCFVQASEDANNKAAAPSFNPEEFPAVTVPVFVKAGRRPANVSIVVVGLGNSSCSKTMAGPFFCGMLTGTI